MSALGVSGFEFEERLHELAGPIVVKEVRQGLRSRVFGIFFGVLLVASLVVALIAVAQADGRTHTGKGFLATYLIGLALVCDFVIPYTAFRSMVREREDETWVLLTLTGLGGGSIVRGKFLSAMSQAMLFASACVPFVVFSYFLNGVDLLQVVLTLVLAAAWSCLSTAAAVALATQAQSRLGRSALHLGALAGLLGGTAFAVGCSWGLAMEGSRLVTEDGFLAFCGGVAFLCVAASVVLLEGGGAALSLPSEESARRPRLALAGFLVLVWATFLVPGLIEHADPELAPFGSVVSSLVLVTAGLFAVSEHDGRRRGVKASWLSSGALRGWALVVMLLVASTLVWLGLYLVLRHHGASRLHHLLLASPLYVALYLSLGAVVARVTPLRKLSEPVASRLACVGLTVLGVLVPPLVAVAVDGSRSTFAAPARFNVLNPIVGLSNFAQRRAGSGELVILAVVTLVVGLVAWLVLSTRDVERAS